MPASAFTGDAEHLVTAIVRQSCPSEDCQRHPLQRQRAQKFRSYRLGLRGADFHAQHLAPAVWSDAARDDDRDRHKSARYGAP